MLRKLDSEIFTYLTQALGNEVSEISSMKSELLIAQSGNWSETGQMNSLMMRLQEYIHKFHRY